MKKVAPNGVFVMTTDVYNSSIGNFRLRNFAVEAIVGVMRKLQRNEVGGTEKWYRRSIYLSEWNVQNKNQSLNAISSRINSNF